MKLVEISFSDMEQAMRTASEPTKSYAPVNFYCTNAVHVPYAFIEIEVPQ